MKSTRKKPKDRSAEAIARLSPIVEKTSLVFSRIPEK